MANKTYDANSISVLEGLEAVRKRPGMYIGSVSTKGLNHLIYEIVDNSVDEFLAGYCDEITVSLNKDGTATITDNGRGIPVGINERTGKTAVEMVFTMLHAGGKFGDGGYKISGGLHGVGASVVNALSTWLTVTVKQGGKIYQQRYERGKIITPLEVIGTCRKSDTGTNVQFLPDPEIFDKTYFKAAMVRNRLHETAYLNPKLTIHYVNEREGEETTVDYHEPEGICAYVKKLNEGKQMLHEPVYFKRMIDGIEAEVAFQYTEDFGENILGFCNNIYTIEGGTHITGFKTKFTTIMNQYAREIGVLKEKDSNFTGTDVRNGMTAIVSVKHPEPRFEGQTKTKLDNPDAAKAVGEIAGEELVLYFDKNLDTLKKVLACAEKSAKIRKAEEKAKTNMLVKQKLSIDSNGKLANCESRKAQDCEIFIVEGDSAGGSAKTARDRATQAILPLRGKILNVEKARLDRVYENAEIKAMITAFGTGIHEDFDITKLRYHKIIIMTDADVDGAHIATLLLTFIYRFMPELIKQGYVYRAQPPLYKLEKNKKVWYAYSDEELAAILDEVGRDQNNKIQRYKGLGEMDAEQLWETTMDPKHRVLLKVNFDESYASDIDVTFNTLMGDRVEPRRLFIEKNAKYVKNLDI